MTGLNFFAYQAFTGWASTYLKEDRGIPDTVVGDVLGWQFVGAAIGGLVWGWISDRFGRRVAAWGFVVAAAIIPVYLFVPLPIGLLELTGFAYGMMLSCSAIWGPWLSELYPPHLRSTAASIFNWGRVISMTAPLITAPLAEAFGRAPVMSLASVSFLVAALDLVPHAGDGDAQELNCEFAVSRPRQNLAASNRSSLGTGDDLTP